MMIHTLALSCVSKLLCLRCLNLTLCLPWTSVLKRVCLNRIPRKPHIKGTAEAAAYVNFIFEAHGFLFGSEHLGKYEFPRLLRGYWTYCLTLDSLLPFPYPCALSLTIEPHCWLREDRITHRTAVTQGRLQSDSVICKGALSSLIIHCVMFLCCSVGGNW